MNRLIQWIRVVFSYSNSEARGFLVLVVILVLSLIMPFVFDNFYEGPKKSMASRDQFLLDSLTTLLLAHNDTMYHKPARLDKIAKQKEFFFKFNPNNASKEELLKLGLHAKVVKGIINYRSKGGKFMIKKDLAKIYNLPNSQYEKIKDFIDLPEERVVEKKEIKIKPELSVLDINLIDTTELIRLKGIGSKLSNRIVKYRNGLGGFVNTSQYREIYGLDSLVLKELMKYCFINHGFVPTKININSVGLSELMHHPYVGKKYATVIINYRNQHGNFKELKDLEKIKILPEDIINKLEPYIMFSL